MATTFLLLASIVCLACAYPNGEEIKPKENEGRAFGSSDASECEVRRDEVTVGDAITGLYTRVSLKTRWPNGIVPWEYNAKLSTYTTKEKELLEKAMKEISDVTCIKFVKKTIETSYITLKNDEVDSCYANVGFKQDTAQLVNLASSCLILRTTGTPIHELMHSLGFEHEMTRYDRDLYVRIQWSNIKPDNAYNFDKYPRTRAFPQYHFDFDSLMMYKRYSFAINKDQPTIIVMKNPKNVKLDDIGRRNQGLVGTDALRINSAYKCSGQGVSINSLSGAWNAEQYSNFF